MKYHNIYHTFDIKIHAKVNKSYLTSIKNNRFWIKLSRYNRGCLFPETGSAWKCLHLYFTKRHWGFVAAATEWTAFCSAQSLPQECEPSSHETVVSIQQLSFRRTKTHSLYIRTSSKNKLFFLCALLVHAEAQPSKGKTGNSAPAWGYLGERHEAEKDESKNWKTLFHFYISYAVWLNSTSLWFMWQTVCCCCCCWASYPWLLTTNIN